MLWIALAVVTTPASGGAAGPASPPPSATESAVWVGQRQVLTLRLGDGVLNASERAQVANSKIADALLDPNCGPEGWSINQEADAFVILLCARRVLQVTEADAEVAGIPLGTLADNWTTALRKAYTDEKRLVFSSRLLQRAITAVLYPLGFVLLLWVLHLADRRVSHRLTAWVAGGQGLRVGRMRLLATGPAQMVLRGTLAAARVVVVVVLTYALLLALLRQFPQTAQWAARLWNPIRGSAGGLLVQLLSAVPRVLLALLILALLRLAFHGTRQLFDQVRAGRLRMEPILSRENATEAEVAARGVLLAVGLFLIALLVPGEGGVVLLAAYGLVAAAFVLGARDLAADLLGGLSGVFLRTFRTGQRIRCGDVTGLVRARGLLYTQLEAEDGDLLLLPNQRLLQHPIEVIGRERVAGLTITVEGEGAADSAPGLFHLASAACGLKRQDERVHLIAVRDGALVFRVQWPIPAAQDPLQARSDYVRALLAKAPGLGLKITAAQPESSA